MNRLQGPKPLSLRGFFASKVPVLLVVLLRYFVFMEGGMLKKQTLYVRGVWEREKAPVQGDGYEILRSFGGAQGPEF